MNDFKKTEFVILDVETTGLSPEYGDRVIELAALKVKGLEVVDRIYSLVDPQRPLSYGAFLVNGISSQMLEGAPRAEDILPSFLQFCQGACLVGHNIRFDLAFLVHETALCRQPWLDGCRALDTVRMAKWLLPGMRRYRLEAVAQALAIEAVQQHRAMADVEMTWEIFRTFLERAFRRDVSDLAGLLKQAEVRMPVLRLDRFLFPFETTVPDEIF